MSPGSIPEYGVSTLCETSVTRAPGSGLIPKCLNTATWLWPPPRRSREWEGIGPPA
jgi:hypothetical protein